jgi:hypothetical protein
MLLQEQPRLTSILSIFLNKIPFLLTDSLVCFKKQ